MKNSVVVNLDVSLNLSDVVRVAGPEAAANLLSQVIASAKSVKVTVDGTEQAKREIAKAAKAKPKTKK